MPKRGVYKGERRKKELSRLKKQEEKRKRRFQSETSPTENAEKVEQKEPTQS